MAPLWIEQTEGAKFWLRVMNELKNRGVQDILLDGVGFPEARGSRPGPPDPPFHDHGRRKHVAKALRDVYRAKDADPALDAFAGKYPGTSWRRNWEHVSPFFVFPEAVRGESLNAKICRLPQ